MKDLENQIADFLYSIRLENPRFLSIGVDVILIQKFENLFPLLDQSKLLFFSNKEVTYDMNLACIAFAAKESLIKALPELKLSDLRNVSIELTKDYPLKVEVRSELPIFQDKVFNVFFTRTIDYLTMVVIVRAAEKHLTSDG